MTSRVVGSMVVGTVGAALLAGCVQQRARPLTPDAFVAPHPADDPARDRPAEQPGPLGLETAPPAGEARTPGESTEEAESGAGVSPTVEQAVRPVREEGFQVPDATGAEEKARGGGANGEPNSDRAAEAAPAEPAPAEGAPAEPAPAEAAPAEAARNDRGVSAATQASPATGPAAGVGSGPAGGYQLVGTVLADVNGSPIYADKVLGVLDRALAAHAKQLDERPFRAKAAELIAKQVREYIFNELEFEMAKNTLTERDQQLASGLAVRWRDEQIARAGGSAEVARQQWEARGMDFEDQVEEQYRTIMVQLYYSRKVTPKIQVTAEDKRRYYQQNLAKEFSQPDQARFRVIQIDPRRRGGRQPALGEINRLLDRARSGGADFAELASGESTNDNGSFRQPAGWIVRGAFVVPEVERAVWGLKPGQITDVVETPNGFYVARLEDLQPGKVLPFTDPAVQQKIQLTLHGEQFKALRQKAQRKKIEDAIIRYHPDDDERRMLRTAVEMAVQKYHYWRTARS